MPQLQKLWSEIQNKRQDVEFICVNINDDRKAIVNYWQEGGFSLRAVQQDESQASDAFAVRYYPTNYLIGPDGKILYRKVMFDRPTLEKKLKP